MTDRKDETDPVDRLVGAFLEREQEQVDAEGFLRRLRERCAAGRRAIRFPMRLVPIAAAAALLVGAFVATLRPVWEAPPERSTGLRLLAFERCADSLRQQMAAAWRGARHAGAAGVSAGWTPLRELGEAAFVAPKIPDCPGALMPGTEAKTEADGQRPAPPGPYPPIAEPSEENDR
jgi:hypothetical protein